jgi:uncharacterized RDD family membrane protein YckC/Tfp pilus assembly major pilin PilA
MYCTNCGAPVSEAGNFCPKCGTQTRTADAPAVAATPAGSPGVASPPANTGHGAGSARDARYAGFWRRVVASFLDGLILAVFNVVLVVGLIGVVMGSGSDPEGDAAVALSWLSGMALSWLYYALLHSSEAQATWGKRALGIKVVSLTGERIGFGRATGRYFATILSSLILGIGFLMAGFTRQRQALHDMVAGTLVVSRETAREDVVAGALGKPKVSALVVVVAVLVCFIPILGILAAIAIPAYQDYLIRTQVSEGLVLAAEVKAQVAEAYAQTGSFDGISSESLGLAIEQDAQYVAEIEVVEGAVAITYGNQANPHLAEQTLVLVPGVNAQQDVVWICGFAAVPDGVTPAWDDYADYTDVERKYLPAACR